MIIQNRDRSGRVSRPRDSIVFGYNLDGGGGNPADPGVIFNLPLNDLGVGAVNTTPTFAAGSPTPTFTRATAAWTKLSTGLWAQVASGTARSAYLGADTAIGAYAGYFGELGATQLVTPTASIRDMTDASWVAVNVTAAKTATGIDGVVNSASTLTAGAIGGSILQTLVAAATSRVYSVFLRRKTGVGTITIQQGATTLDVTAQLNASTYTRVSLTASVLNSAFGIIFGTSGDAVEADFNQFEATVLTSPMASTGAARSADVLTYVATGNCIAAAGSLYIESATFNAGASTAYDGIALSAGGVPYLANSSVMSNDGTNTANTATGLTINVISKIATSWGTLGLRAVKDGGTVATNSFDGGMGNDTGNIQFHITAGIPFSTTSKNVKIYSSQFSDANLQALTT